MPIIILICHSNFLPQSTVSKVFVLDRGNICTDGEQHHTCFALQLKLKLTLLQMIKLLLHNADTLKQRCSAGESLTVSVTYNVLPSAGRLLCCIPGKTFQQHNQITSHTVKRNVKSMLPYCGFSENNEAHFHRR